MTDVPVEQALYGNQGGNGYRFLARSPGFLDAWLAEAQRLCTGFGERPAGVGCPLTLFAQPFGKGHVAIVRAADQGSDEAGRPGALAFHLLVLPREAYRGFGGDPFTLADRCPPCWEARGELPSLTWPAKPVPPRTVDEVRRVLQRPDGPNLLGGAQVLVDGGRLVFVRSAPDPDLLRGLWTLLPSSTRSERWPASFAFGNALGFHALAVPNADGAAFAPYTTEVQAGDYPEGRYELAVQTAAEAGDQRELDRLFARRSAAETMRLGLVLLAVAVVLAVLMSALNAVPSPESKRAAPTPKQEVSAAKLELPPPGDYPALTADERNRLTRQLATVAARLGVQPPPQLQAQAAAAAVGGGVPAAGAVDAALAQMRAEALLEAIDARLGTPAAGRDPGPLAKQGPVQRQLRALLWKHGVAAYNDPRLNASELVERLGEVLERRR